MHSLQLLMAGVSAQALDLEAPDGAWEQTGSARDYRTYMKTKPGSTVPEILLVGLVDADPQACFSVVGDYEGFPDFMPFMHYAKVVHSERKDDNTVINYVFFFVTPPLVSNRYYTIRLIDEKDADNRPGVFRSAWTLEKGRYRKTPSDPDIKKHVKRGLIKPVEMESADGYWLFEPAGDGKTRVSYYAWIHPGGSIPDSVAEKVNTVGLPKLWTAFKNRLASQG